MIRNKRTRSKVHVIQEKNSGNSHWDLQYHHLMMVYNCVIYRDLLSAHHNKYYVNNNTGLISSLPHVTLLLDKIPSSKINKKPVKVKFHGPNFKVCTILWSSFATMFANYLSLYDTGFIVFVLQCMCFVQWRLKGTRAPFLVQFLSFSCSFQQKLCQTRMHSSTMRTARSSSHLGGGSPPPWEQTPLEQKPPPGAGTPGAGTPRSRHPPCEQNHRRLWKYNLAPTSLRAVIIGWRSAAWARRPLSEILDPLLLCFGMCAPAGPTGSQYVILFHQNSCLKFGPKKSEDKIREHYHKRTALKTVHFSNVYETIHVRFMVWNWPGAISRSLFYF